MMVSYSQMELFYTNLKRIRKNKGLTQEQLGTLVNTSRAYITHLETGNRTPTLNLVEKIANALNVPVKELFEDIPNE